jgi:predicted GNAT family N-acyltransferase
MPITIREVKDGSDFAIAMAIRMQVFVHEQKVPLEVEMDDHDAEATHYLAAFEGKPVATARTRMVDATTAKIERVAVLKDQRGHGIGLKLMSHLVARLRNHPQVKAITINAQVVAVPFYEKMDFVVEGEMFLEADIPHYKMRLAQ